MAFPTAGMIPLVDRFGRRHHRLRLSVTDRCNLRCTYCMPAVGATFVPRNTLLTFEEMTRVVGVLSRRCGIDGVRLTGGEPLVRSDLSVLVSMLARIETLTDLSLTTNGILLGEQASDLWAAGLRRVNVSIDSLDPERSAAITRRDRLDQTIAGIHAAIDAGMHVKLNALAIAGSTERDAVSLVRFAIERGVTMRFIEFMPLDADGAWTGGSVLRGDDLLAILRDSFDRVRPIGRDEPSAPAELFEARDRRAGRTVTGRLGIIRSVSQPFCGDCNRLRLTAEGAMRNCLFANEETPLREILRSGGTDQDLIAAFQTCVAGKAEGHGGVAGPTIKPSDRPMYSIGG